MLHILPGQDLTPAVEALHDGGIICYPTETFYALGIDPWNADAQTRLAALKRRPEEKQWPLIAADIQMVAAFCDTSDRRFTAIAAAFWPGPLTVVLPALTGSGAYAVRVSPHPVARRLSELAGKPIVSTSANLSGEPPVEDPNGIHPEILKGLDCFVDGGRCPGGLPSTIVSLAGAEPSVLREGAISLQSILAVL